MLDTLTIAPLAKYGVTANVNVVSNASHLPWAQEKAKEWHYMLEQSGPHEQVKLESI